MTSNPAFSCNCSWGSLPLWHHLVNFGQWFLHSFQRLLMHFPRWHAAVGWGNTRFSILAFRHRPFQRVARVSAEPAGSVTHFLFLFLLESFTLLASKSFGLTAARCWHVHFLLPSVTCCFHNLHAYLYFLFWRTHFGSKVKTRSRAQPSFSGRGHGRWLRRPRG